MTTVDLVSSNPNPGVLELRLNRPRSANALNTALLQQLAEALETAAQDGSVRAVVITGGSVLFSIGADLKEFPAMLATDDAALENRNRLYKRIFAA
ncbi:MAG: enoyl-CoA hydratase/isomerase family protein [Gammaproteobacteria bacterium]|nr:enoyl-CoA hydratase/isomerase family protein [Gammaproteobacteria bacterium]